MGHIHDSVSNIKSHWQTYNRNSEVPERNEPCFEPRFQQEYVKSTPAVESTYQFLISLSEMQIKLNECQQPNGHTGPIRILYLLTAAAWVRAVLAWNKLSSTDGIKPLGMQAKMQQPLG